MHNSWLPTILIIYVSKKDQGSKVVSLIELEEFILGKLEFTISKINMGLRSVREFYLTEGAVSLVGSCNGLLCFLCKPNTFYLWNPLRRETVFRSGSETGASFVRQDCGFEYCGRN